MDLIGGIFDLGGFSPHGICVLWNPILIWLDASADGLIAVAYFSIPLAIILFLLNRRDVEFPWIFTLFGAFIFLCGITHIFGAVTFWVPVYGLEAVFKVLTAAVSIATAAALWPMIPRALALPSLAKLRSMNADLGIEVAQRRDAETSLRESNERLKAQVEARNWSEQRFRLLVEAVDNCALIMLDQKGIVTSWNAGAEHIKGYREDEIIGQHFSRFYTDEDKSAGKPQRALDIADIQGRFEDEGWRVRKDGSRFWASLVIAAIRSPDGHLLGYGKVTRDLTERRRTQRILTDANAELELRVRERTESLSALTVRLEKEVEDRKAAESERREAAELLQATFDAAPFPIILIGRPNRVLMWNKAGEATFGYSEAELMERGPGALVAHRQWSDVAQMYSLANLRKLTTETQITHRDGRLLDVKLSAAPLFRADGTTRAAVAMMEDLTKIKQTEAQLRQSQKMEAIGTLTGGMAHDFNNLLGIIIGNLELLRETRRNDPEVNELTGESLDAAMRGAELTRSLLAFARRQPLQPMRVELDLLIGGLVKLLGRLLGDDIEIDLNLKQDTCAVTADPAQLEAALTNLVTNARDAMPSGGKLSISTGHRQLDREYASVNPDVTPGSYALIEVTDTGVGMSPEVQTRIFEPFFTTKNEHGTGLGLSMVFGFMKQSGGHISVYSEVGVGTTFRLYFPCSTTPEDTKMEPRSDGPFAGRGETVLAVEDSASLRRIVVRQLRAWGYRVLEAGNGPEALTVLEQEKVDLLFTDVVMPGMIDGFALADAAVSRWPGVKVILTSGFPQSRFADASRVHAYPLLSKPYRKGVLAQMIRAALDDSDETPRP